MNTIFYLYRSLTIFSILIFSTLGSEVETTFISDQFSTQPEKKSFWITKERRKVIESILQHPYKKIRIHYWQHQSKVVVILNEIGKIEDITFGYVIDQNQITKAEVLIYRESRGGEIRSPAFRRQFLQSQMTSKHKLNRKIDGITGATLSVRAMTKTATIALYLYHQVTQST